MEGGMDRIKRNPGGWGLALGGAIGLVSILFGWIEVTNAAANETTRVHAYGTVAGQTIGFCALLAVIAGLGVSASTGGGRIWWGLLGLLGAGVLLAAGLIGIFSPSTLAQRFATTELVSTMKLSDARDSAMDAIKTGFSSGTLTARVAIGAIIGTVGGVLGVLGAFYGFRKKPERD
jgi:hypothetical protein